MSKPYFLIIGAMRAGSTSLFDVLSKHSQLSVPKDGVKEINFFDTYYPYSSFDKGIDWYYEQFENKGLPFEASCNYLYCHYAPEIIKHYLPEIKLIVLLRNPIDRAYSHYQHCIHPNKKRDTLSFSDAIRKEDNRLPDITKLRNKISYEHSYYSYLSKSDYYRQIKRYLRHFNTKQILFIKSEDLFKNPQNELEKVFKFLDIKIEKLPFVHHHKLHYNKMKNEDYIFLKDYFKEKNKKLYNLIGINFNKDE